jgi:hypothetical protein
VSLGHLLVYFGQVNDDVLQLLPRTFLERLPLLRVLQEVVVGRVYLGHLQLQQTHLGHLPHEVLKLATEQAVLLLQGVHHLKT